jgi:hypothetical protein
MALLLAAHMASLLGWLCLLPTVFLGKLHHSWHLWLLESPLQLQFHNHSLTSHPIRGCQQGLQACHTWPVLPGFPLKSWWKLPQPHNTFILQCCKTNILWMTSRSTTGLRISQASMDCGCSGLWVPGWLITGKSIPNLREKNLTVGAEPPGVFFSNQSLWACNGWGLADSWDAHCPNAKYLASF